MFIEVLWTTWRTPRTWSNPFCMLLLCTGRYKWMLSLEKNKLPRFFLFFRLLRQEMANQSPSPLFTLFILRGIQQACLQILCVSLTVLFYWSCCLETFWTLPLRVFFCFVLFFHMFECLPYLMLLFWLFSALLEIDPLFTQKLQHHWTNTGCLKHLSA